MRRKNAIFIFCALMLTTSVWFQNCSEMQSSNTDSTNDGLGDGPDPREIPAFLANRALVFDNKVVSNDGFSVTFNVGGADIIYYETDYGATYESTLVTISGGSGVAPALKVQSDSCNGERNISNEEAEQVVELFAMTIPFTEIRVRGADQAPDLGCSFPRLALNVTKDPQSTDPEEPIDLDIYLSSPECTPSGEFFVTDRDGNDPAVTSETVAAFFEAQIDAVCSTP